MVGVALEPALLAALSFGILTFNGPLESVFFEAGESFWGDASVAFSVFSGSGWASSLAGDEPAGDDTAPLSCFSAGSDVDLLCGDALLSEGFSNFSNALLTAPIPLLGGEATSDALSDPGWGVAVAEALSPSG